MRARAVVCMAVFAALMTSTPARAAQTVFSVDCSQLTGFVIDHPGTYVLKNSVSCASILQVAIHIEASRVILDGNGMAIDGYDGTGTIGVEILLGTSHVVVHDLTLTNFDDGMRVSGGPHVVRDNVVRSSTSNGILGTSGTGNTFRGNTLTDSGVSGLFLGSDTTAIDNVVSRSAAHGVVLGNRNVFVSNHITDSGGIGINAGDENRISRNVVSRNASGIGAQKLNRITRNRASGNLVNGGVKADDGSVLSRNVADGNVGDGLFCADNCVVTRNTAVGNDGTGIRAATSSRVTDNVSSGNTSHGIEIFQDSTVLRNRVRANGGNGIRGGFTGNTISLNTVGGSAFTGILAFDESTIVRNVSRGNGGAGIIVGDHSTVSRNVANGNTSDGIMAGGSNDILSNRAGGNGDDGIEITTPTTATTVSGNRVRGNVDWGIEGGAGPLSGGGNLASDNGQTAQCQPAGLCP